MNFLLSREFFIFEAIFLARLNFLLSREFFIFKAILYVRLNGIGIPGIASISLRHDSVRMSLPPPTWYVKMFRFEYYELKLDFQNPCSSVGGHK